MLAVEAHHVQVIMYALCFMTGTLLVEKVHDIQVIIIMYTMCIYDRHSVGCGGTPCSGPHQEEQECLGDKPQHCEWDDWGTWGQCSQITCDGNGTRQRTRGIR